jgi:hypothetical protein
LIVPNTTWTRNSRPRGRQDERGIPRTLSNNHLLISRQIAAIERAVLAFQPAIVGAAGRRAAVDTNIAIILSARLSTVWKRLGDAIPHR